MPDVLSAAAEPTRRRILQLLASGPRTVNDLAANFSVTRSAISQHLGVLSEVGLVTNRKEGRQRIYSVDPTGMARLRTEIDRFWTDELDLLVADATALAARRPTDHRSQPANQPPNHAPPIRGRTTMTAEKTAHLPVSPDEAFALVTDPERLRRWQAVSARVDLRAGGEYRWTVVPGHIAAGTFTEVEPGRRVVFGWGWEGSSDLPPDASTVTVTIEPDGDGSLVRLIHEGLTEEQVAGHLEGWNHFFERLERAASTGDAGPDEWAAAPQDLNRLSCADATLAVCQHVLRQITDADLTKPTPCTEYTVGQLADHLVGSMVGLGAMAGAQVAAPETGTVEDRVAVAAQQALEAWNRRGLDGTVAVGEAEMPAQFAANILSLEFLVHAWDFATATGQKVTVSDEVTSYVLELAEQVIGPQQREGGSFAAAIEVGPDAHVLDRLIAFSGRAAV